jgi:vitamin B12/bleomycin/antimicrobial peptide transport system ATP-binding/permease protein
VYVNQWLQIRWRRWLTDRYLKEWLAERTYYRMQLTGGNTDNPDQRIAEDLKLFVDSTLDLVLGGLNALVTLGAFLTILWGLSGTLEFTWRGETYAIYGYMLWVALAYAVIGTWLTHKVGKPLIGLNFTQQRFEADFRYNLVRFRENTEGVALYRGEAGELNGFRERFRHVADNWWSIMKRIKLLNTFRYGYNQAAIVFPYLVAAPRYFSGKFTLGDLTQTAGAFGQVQSALSWFINVYVLFATWKATVDRLTGFHNAVMNAQAQQRTDPGVTVQPGTGTGLQLDHVELILPTGRTLRCRRTSRACSCRSGRTSRSARCATPCPIRRCRAPTRTRRSGKRSPPSACRTSASGWRKRRTGRCSSPAASSSGWRSRAPSCTSRSGCSWTKPPPRWTMTPRRACIAS